jgi:hypothetical protein
MYGIRKSENVIMKNIIALRIPTFITKDNGAAARLFSYLIKVKSRKNIAAAINISSNIFK